MRINDLNCKQVREVANLRVNNTGFYQAEKLFFVQLDEYYAVDNAGCIFQIIDEIIDEVGFLQYEGQSGLMYNYAEDIADFEDDISREIYYHCFTQAELSAENYL